MAAVKSVLVTGCSEGGIGYALVEAFQKRGLRVFATARNPLKMQALSALSNVILLQLDPTSPESVKAAVENVRDTMVTLDYLVNNAGQGITMPTLDVDIGKAKELFDINLWGALRVMQAFAPLVIAAKGTIISNCSIVTSLNGPWISIYTSSKLALQSITDILRLELKPLGVRVITIHTGAVKSRIMEPGKDAQLPPDSIFKMLEPTIARRARGDDNIKRMETADYADRVVRDVLDGSGSQIWRGGYASVVYLASLFLPTYVSDWLSIQDSGLESWRPLQIR